MPITPPNERRGAHTDAASPQDDPTIRLHQMQERLAELGAEARSIRAQFPHECEPDVENVQQQMEVLGDRLADLNVGTAHFEAEDERPETGWAEYCAMLDEKAGEVAGKQNKVSPVETKFEQCEATASSELVEPADPWDEASVVALVGLYESGEARFGRDALANDAKEPHRAAVAEASATSWPEPIEPENFASIEPVRLEHQFAEIAQRIQRSLSEIRPDSSLLKLGHRFDQLEERMSSALGAVATRADIEELRHAEAQVDEISEQLGRFRGQLSRLDTIDAHLETLSQQLSDEKLAELLNNSSSPANDTTRFDAVEAQLASIAEQLSDERVGELMVRPATPARDLEELAASVADLTVERVAKHDLWETQSRNLGEVRGLVENLINERRINDENNVSMLETMQQAIIRVLDRIDALESAQQSESLALRSSDSVQAEAEAEPAHVGPIIENNDDHRCISLTHARPEPDIAREKTILSEIATEPSSYVSLTHPQPESGMEAEPTAPSGSAVEQSTNISPALRQPPSETAAELSEGDAFAGLDDEMIYEPPPFLRSKRDPSYAVTLDDRKGDSYAPPGSLPAPEESPLASSAFFGDMIESELDAESEEIGSTKPVVLSIDELRQNLIAEAHRAKIRAASKPEDMAASDESIAVGESGEMSTATRVSGKLLGMIMPFASMCTRRVTVGVLALLLILPAAVLLMPRSDLDERGATAPDAVHSIPALHGAAETGASKPNPNTGVSPKQINKALPGSGPNGEAGRDAGELTPETSPARVDTASIPRGIMLLGQRELNSDELARAQEAQGMAFLSNQLGIAAAKATPASLMQEYILAQQPGASKPNEQGGTETGNSLKLPPATVGPFSLRLAAAQGVASAQFAVAARLAKGDVTDQNLEAAAGWYHRSASQGFAMAQYRLGTLYERGLGVKMDLARAQIWYRRAAQQGNLKAMHNLAVLSAGREGRTPDYAAAAQWFSQAAERGLADSQYNLAMLYESGLGVPYDLKQAYKWLVLASKSGDLGAERRRKNLKTKLSRTDRAEAENLARSWRAKASNPMFNDARVAGQAWQRRSRG